MSRGLELDLQAPCGRFEVQLAWRTAQAALGLFGPSGAGKTTVLESIAGLRRDARGRIVVNGQVWLDSARGLHRAPEQRGVGYVPQDLRLFPHLDVLGNLAVGARRAAASARRLRPEQVLDVLELTPLARLPVTRLSGGERQRVALARALCSGPELLLLDEPLASLDLPLRRRILPHLLRVREEFQIPTLHVSHDVAEVTLLCAEVCVLAAGQVVAHGRPEEVFATQGAAAGPKNVLQGKVIEVGGSLARVEIEPGLALAVADDGSFAPGQRVALELAASDVLVALAPPVGLSAQNVFEARIREVHLDPTGDPRASAVVITDLGREGRSIAVVVSQRACHQLALAPGVTVHLIFKAQACRLLAAY